MQTFYKRLTQEKDKLSKLEKEVLEFIMQHPEVVSNSNLQNLSKKIFVSTATISRTCKQLGYSGYQELRYTLTQLLEESSHSKRIDSGNENRTEIERMKQDIEATFQYIKEIDIQKTNSLIYQSKQIEFFGVGASYTSCLEASRKLTFSGKISNAREDWDELRIVAKNLTKDDLAIILSYSGETIHILEYATILSNNSVPILSITGDFNNRLKKLSTYNCQVQSNNRYVDSIDLCSRIPINMATEYIINSFITNTHQ